MITYITGNLFESPAQTLINTVNTVGVMGKGLALTFKQLYPEMFEAYRVECQEKRFEIGSLFLWRTPQKWILNFPTKREWRRPSKVEYIEAGLRKFVAAYDSMGIQSAAFPPLGCGNGELDFEKQVQPIMDAYLDPLPIDIFIYRPLPRVAPVEHRDIERMKEWLRSEPEYLPTSEVWADLCAMFAEPKTFPTISKKAEVIANYDGDADVIRLRHGGRQDVVTQDDVDNMWHALTTFGLVTTRTASPKFKPTSRLVLAMLAQLDYVSTVPLASSYDTSSAVTEIGLQRVPRSKPARTQRSLVLK